MRENVNAAQDCGNLLIGSCYSKEEVRNQKDEQVSQRGGGGGAGGGAGGAGEATISSVKLRGIISKMEKTVKGWDSLGCPIIK